MRDPLRFTVNNRRLVSLVDKVPFYCAGGSGSIPGQTNTQLLKLIEEMVLPSFSYLHMV